MGRMRHCVECGTAYEVETRGRPPIRCPEHRRTPTLATIRAGQRRISVCQECGVEFTQPPGGGKPFQYCETHRGVLNTRRRANARKGIVRGRAFTHVCNERCHEVERLIRQYPVPTLQQIGDRFGVSREMIRLIISQHGWRKPSSYNGWACPICGDRVTISKAEHIKTLSHERAKRARMEAMARRKMNWDLGSFIYALHKAGYTPSEITYLTDSYPLAPYRWLLMLGENPYRGGKGPHARLNPQRAAERDRQVALAYAEGVSNQSIMEMFDLKYGNLQRIIKERGVKRPAWYIKEFTEAHMAKMREIQRVRREAAKSDNA